MPSAKWIALLAAIALAPAAGAQNLLANPSFDHDLSGWQVDSPVSSNPQWVADDALGLPTSGSLGLTYKVAGTTGVLVGAKQCVPVTGGQPYDLASWVKVPAGQPYSGAAYLQVGWFGDTNCSDFLDFHRETVSDTGGDWVLVAANNLAVPAGAQSAGVELFLGRNGAGGDFSVQFDEPLLCLAGVCEQVGIPEPPYASWITSPRLPGFSAQARITTPNGTIQGQGENDCVAETICVRGALAGRPEVFAKVIGPRPNGYLWAQVIRFTPSQVELWLRQDATGEVNYYRLDAVVTQGELSGLDHRTAFLP